ncbi:MAG: replicative DNA helicase [Candidatus Harrisonbacteria bacterium]|nr:replicative DNA helicase [Candidatus Harrisonbacteria bacterium]
MAKREGLKLPPQNIDAEQSVLGSLMVDKNAIIQVADVLRPNDFYHPQNSAIYEAILSLFEKRRPIDILSVTTELKERNILKEIGGSTHLSKLVEMVPSATHVLHYAKMVRDKKILRDLIATSAEISEKAFNPDGELDETLDEIEQKIFAISQHSVQQKFTLIKEELPKAYERLEKMHSGERPLGGIGTGFSKLDFYLSGLRNSDMVVVGARPSLGKTSFVLDIARHAAVKEQKSVGVFSLEMSKDQIIDRIIAAEAEVPLSTLRTGRVKNDTDFELVQRALDSLSRAPLFIDDTPSPNVLQMRSMARRLQAEHGLDLLIVDYLQLIQPKTGSDNIVQQITEISRNIKGLARELNVPIIAVSQLSRGVEQREIKIPRLSDLRESGSIEQDADVVLFLYRKDRDKLSPSPEEQGMAEIIIAKHRNGPLGSVQLKFDEQKTTFRNLDTTHTNVA